MAIEEHLGTVTQKGQVTIPLAVRRLLGIKPNDRVAFRVKEGRVELLPAQISLEAAYGAIKPLARPENWKAIRQHAREERTQRQVGKMRSRRKGPR